MRTSPVALRLAVAAMASSCVAAVMAGGELSGGALLAICTAGTTVVVLGYVRRSGETAPPVGRRGLPWLALAGAALSWEMVTLAHDELPTASDLADPFLAHPLARGAATACWLAVGAALLHRPRRRTPR